MLQAKMRVTFRMAFPLKKDEDECRTITIRTMRTAEKARISGRGLSWKRAGCPCRMRSTSLAQATWMKPTMRVVRKVESGPAM